MSSSTNLDLNIIPTYNNTTIAIGDASVYPEGVTITSPSLEITIPGFNKKSVVFTPNSLNIYNSNTLGITDNVTQESLAVLPDGVWKLKYSYAPSYDNYINISFLKSDLIEEKFSNAWLSLDFNTCDPSLVSDNRNNLMNIWGYIISAKSCAKVCNYKLSVEQYQMANKKLDAYLKLNCYGMSNCQV